MDYGIIGNCRTCALIKKDGAIEWCCFPRFDSPSVFAKLLDKEKGGSFEIIPKGSYKIKQKYIKNTNVIETTFFNAESKFKLIDFFVRYRESNGDFTKENSIYRLIKVLKGSPKIKIVFNPKFNYAGGKTKISLKENKITASQKNNFLHLSSSLNLRNIISEEHIVLPKESFFSVGFNTDSDETLGSVKQKLKYTQTYWRNFVSRGTWPKNHRDATIRSALILKLLTYTETGAMIAAATTSLPEIVGGERNWDYRYCWLRDSSFTVTAFTRICHFHEAQRYFAFLKKILKKSRAKNKLNLKIMYSVLGERNMKEATLKNLAGYKNSRPVRIGNAAYRQNQIDVIGEVIDALHEYFVHYKYVETLGDEMWDLIKLLASHLIKNWQKKDHSMWEFRKLKKHFTFSKFMCWTGINKAIEIAETYKRPFPHKWLTIREEIKDYILEKTYSKKKNSFAMFPNSDVLDSSLLLMVHHNFLSAKDEKIKNTVRAIEKELSKKCFVFRYKMKDDFGIPENAFLVCSFWLVDALYLTGQKEKARRLFKQLMNYSNHLGLYSEDINAKTGELTGNFPQAYVHISLINSAILLSGKGTVRQVCKLSPDVFLTEDKLYS